jgi:class 3 adenylate cyclase
MMVDGSDDVTESDDVAQTDAAAETDDVAAIRERARALPWWRRPRELRRQLAWTLAATALASVLLVGGLNYFAAEELLDRGTQDQLVGIGQARARTIENGVDRVLGQVSAISGDLGVVTALEALANGFGELEGAELTDEQETALEQHYESVVVDRYAELGLDPVSVDEFLPASAAARYLQYHYVVVPAEAGVDPSSIDNAGDGSTYSAEHEIHHEALDQMLTGSLGAGDAMLVTTAGDVVYSVDKRIDFGTNLFDGPYDDSQLATLLRDRLPRVRSGSALMADLELYVPVGGGPVFFAAAAVKNETEIIGVLAIEIPAEELSAITTTNEQWERFGLQTGESYVVGSDRLLRSESRLWIEDPEAYLDDVEDDAVASLAEGLGSPIGLQVVDTKPVATALDGDEFRGSSKNYLGTRNFSYAQPIDVPGVDWVVVVDVPLDDARSPLYDYAKRLGLVLLIILPAAALAGLWLARRLTRPIGPVLAAATAIVEGDRNPDIPNLGNDEFGDLARRLGLMADDLGAREAALAAEYDERRQLLLAVLPPRLIDDSGEVSDTGDLADVATVVAINVDVTTDELREDEERVAELLDEVASLAEQATADRGLERVRGSADSYLYLAGVGVPDDGAAAALDFVDDHLRRFAELREHEGLDIALRIGVATGPIATGVLDSGSLTFGAWGLPVRQAAALAAMSDTNEVLIDASTAAAVGDARDLTRTDEVIALDGESMDLYTLATR